MALDDFLEPEVAVAVAVTAAVASPTVRKTLRKGIVYGLAGLLIARDKIADFAHQVKENVRQTAAPEEKEAPAAPASAPVPEVAPS
jgi:hypothetical protein